MAVATKLFWKNGYDGTSMDELIKHTGLNRYGMYSEFGDKERLFISCIDHYVHEDSKEVVRMLMKEPVGLKNLEEFINNRVQYAMSVDCKGCLLVNTVIKKEAVSNKVNDKVCSILKGQENLIHLCLEAAQQKGEIPKQSDCKALTIYLSCFFRGLMSLGRATQDKASLEKLPEIVLSTIKG